MNDYDTKRATRYLPHVVAANTAVVVMPVVLVWWLRSRGAITSPWAGVMLAMALSLAALLVGSAYWKRRRGPRDLLFGELLVWGWLRRVRTERQLTRSMGLLRTDEQVRGGRQDADRTFHILSQLAVALDAQDAYTDGHSRRVAAYAVMVARRMGLPNGEVARVRAAAAVHDIGKVHVPREVLDKPGRLTSTEFDLVKRHADVGAEIVDSLGDPEVTAIVRHHHERFEGTGYPSGLAYERIPLGARIIAVADTFDALTSVRPYRPAAPHKRALDALAGASGTQLDPVAVRAFLRSYSGNKAIVFWSLLAISPRRAVDWLGDKSRAAGHVSLSPTAATAGAVTAIAFTAISTPVGARPVPSVARDVYSRAVAAASVGATIGAPRTRSHHPGHRPTAQPATRRGHAAHGIGRVSAAIAVAASIMPRGSGSVHRHAVRRSSGAEPSGLPRHRPAGGGPSDGSQGGTLRKPAGGGPSGRSKGAPARVPVAGSGRGSSSGPGGGASGSSGGSGAGRPSTKNQCKHGGYVQHGFANQGQCVATAERGPRKHSSAEGGAVNSRRPVRRAAGPGRPRARRTTPPPHR